HPPALRATAPARLILQILRAPRERFPRETIVALCRSPHLTAIDADLARTLDQIGYVDGSAQPLMDRFECHVEELRRAIEKAGAEGAERRSMERRLVAIERAAARFERMMAALEPLAQSGTLAEHLERLEHALDLLGFDPA